MCFSIRLLAEEKRIAESYAKMRSMSLEEAFKQALFERIEDEYDIAVAAEACAEYERSGRKQKRASRLFFVSILLFAYCALTSFQSSS